MSTPLTEDVEDDYDDYYVWPDEGEDEEDLEAAIFDLEAPPLTLMAADAPPYLRVAAALIEPFAPSGLAIPGQIAHFDRLPAEVAAELLRVVPDEHLQFRQGGVAPTARAMLEQCAAHPSRTCQGYITLPPRDDQRLAVDGLTCPDLGWDARETGALYAKLAPLEQPDAAGYYPEFECLASVVGLRWGW